MSTARFRVAISPTPLTTARDIARHVRNYCWCSHTRPLGLRLKLAVAGDAVCRRFAVQRPAGKGRRENISVVNGIINSSPASTAPLGEIIPLI